MDFSVLFNVGVVVVILAVLFMAWGIWRTGQRPESLGEWAVQVEAAEQWALLAVEAAEQLWQSGQIEKGQRFHQADVFLADTLPNLDAGQRQMIIEAAVWTLKQIRESGMLSRLGEREIER